MHIEHTADGLRRLRFTVIIVNVGTGPLEVRARRAAATAPWVIEQRLYSATGSSRSIVVSKATLAFGGDGHNHWHLKDLQHYELERLDNGARVGTSMKSGFCFFDTDAYRLTLLGAPRSAVYTSANVCTGGSKGLETRMGVSGWLGRSLQLSAAGPIHQHYGTGIGTLPAARDDGCRPPVPGARYGEQRDLGRSAIERE